MGQWFYQWSNSLARHCLVLISVPVLLPIDIDAVNPGHKALHGIPKCARLLLGLFFSTADWQRDYVRWF